jgi:hypothetical protein
MKDFSALLAFVCLSIHAYRPIALETTLGKLIESVVTKLLSYAVEESQLTLPQHYGGRPGRTGVGAMLMLVEKDYACMEGVRYSIVFMNVTGTFNCFPI